jgi:hypothetical protein
MWEENLELCFIMTLRSKLTTQIIPESYRTQVYMSNRYVGNFHYVVSWFTYDNDCKYLSGFFVTYMLNLQVELNITENGAKTLLKPSHKNC